MTIRNIPTQELANLAAAVLFAQPLEGPGAFNVYKALSVVSYRNGLACQASTNMIPIVSRAGDIKAATPARFDPDQALETLKALPGNLKATTGKDFNSEEITNLINMAKSMVADIEQPTPARFAQEFTAMSAFLISCIGFFSIW